jgi:peptide/nickel transport system substrate-binding protein
MNSSGSCLAGDKVATRWSDRRVVALLTIVSMAVSAACTGSTEPTTPSASAQPQPGGVLRLGAVSDCRAACDPQKQQDMFPEFVYQCCLLRTLIQVEPTATGPKIIGDIAEGPPTVSSEGLAYTFSIRDGVSFGPPVSRAVTSQDFITTFARALSPATRAFDAEHYMPILGAKEFAAGDASRISGLATPDDRTLVITLSAPEPLFLAYLSGSSVAPIPHDMANGHDKDYGRFLASTGPYMLQGSDSIDLTQPPSEQSAPAGYRPGQSMVLVRNPDWDRSSDPIRGGGAYPDEIEITIGGSAEDYGQKIIRGELDLQIDGTHPAEILRQYATDASLMDRVVSENSPAVAYASLTVASPPFDDVHVRRAVNWIVDKGAIIRLIGGPLNGTIAHHVFPNVTLGGALADYRPFGTPSGAGDLERAKMEMRLSSYDTDGDGLCDAPECSQVVAVGDPASPYSDIAQSLAQDFSKIGIELKLQLSENRFEILDDPSNGVPMDTIAAWGSASYDPSDIAAPVFGSEYIGPQACCNEVLLGATPQQLEEWGYPVESVPDVDPDIARCDAMLLGPERTDCWIEVDKLITQELAVWVPLYEEKITRIISDRVVSAPWSPIRGFIAIDAMAVQE